MDSKKLDLNLLVALEALLAESNVTRAAQRLNLSQPAMSAQLSRLRSTFGDRLFVPTSRGVLPTSLAAEVEKPLREALDQLRGIVSRARKFDPSNSEATFCIASSDYVQIAILLPFLLQVNEVAPATRIKTKALDLKSIGAEIERGEVDLAFFQPHDADAIGLRNCEVIEEHYVGIARKGTVPNGMLSLEQFVAARHIIVSPRTEGFRGPADDALSELGLSRRVVFAASSFMFLIEAVSLCDVIALAPARLARRYLDRLDLFEPPLAVPGFTISMAWHERSDTHPAQSWLREQLASFCREVPKT